MKKIYLIVAAQLSIFLSLASNINVQAQRYLPYITAKKISKSLIKLSWINQYESNCSQISIQRSYDSTFNYTTLRSVQSPELRINSYLDTFSVFEPKIYYRLFYVLYDGKQYGFSLPATVEIDSTVIIKNLKEKFHLYKPKHSVNADQSAFTQPKTNDTIKTNLVSKEKKQTSTTKKLSVSDSTKTTSISQAPKTKKSQPVITSEKKLNSNEVKSKKKDSTHIPQASIKKNIKTVEPNQKNSDKKSESINNISKQIKDSTNNDDVVIVSSRKKKKVVQDSTKKATLDTSAIITTKNENSNTSTQTNNTTLDKQITKSPDNDTTNKVKSTKATNSYGLATTGGPLGKITGKVINEKTGEPLAGATLTFKSGNVLKKIVTDYNGNFTTNLPEGLYTITCSFTSFAVKTVDEVKVIKNDVVTQDITMGQSKNSDLKDVVVRSTSAKRNVETVTALQIMQKNAASVSDGISAESIKRTPDRNTSDIMKRVSGASIQEDKFAIIRGLNDRYNAVFLNGAPLPSSESDRKAFAFDIFPANMLDNLIITKTATPDMNADFAGGIITINTKDIPTKDFQSVSFGLGFNTQATFQDRKYYKGGRWDWIGLDDGTRALSPNIPEADIKNASIAEKAQFGKYYGNSWKTYNAVAPVNYNFQYVRGLNIQKKNKDYLGVLLALTYNRSYNKTYGDRRGLFYDVSNTDTNITPQYTGMFVDQNFSTQVLASALVNVSLKINDNNKLSLKNLFSLNSEDKVIERLGNVDFTNEPNLISQSTIRWFTSNSINSSQLNGEHFLKKYKLKINWTLGLSGIQRDIPNRRISSKSFNLNDPTSIKADVNTANQPSPDVGGAIFYSKLTENIKSLKLDIERDFKYNNFNTFKFKTGLYLQGRDRDFAARYLSIYADNSNPTRKFADSLLSILDDGKIFDPKNFGRFKNGKYGFQLTEDYRPSNKYGAGSDLFASYVMLDARVFKFIRLIGGVRNESFTQKLNSINDGNNKPFAMNKTVSDFLPSVNLVFSINSKQNLRFAYSKTINRPEYRELAPFIYYDFVTRLSIEGDTNINRALIDNYDVRYEIFPGKGQMLSVSGFYKSILNPIEIGFNPTIENQAKYFNADKAEIKGVELEFRSNLGSLFNLSTKHILNNFTAFGNLALIQSNVTFIGNNRTLYGDDRPLQGQSPYLFNAGFIYQQENGWSGTLQYNQIGQRIFVAGNVQDASLWEHTRPILDLQIAKTFEKSNIEFKINFKDILAMQQIFFYDLNRNNKYDEDLKPKNAVLDAKTDKIFSTTNFGRVISTSITYKF